MSHFTYDPADYEVVSEHRPCTSCGGIPAKCDGRCNGSASWGMRRRDPKEAARIKAERQRVQEDEILSQAELIKARRGERP